MKLAVVPEDLTVGELDRCHRIGGVGGDGLAEMIDARLDIGGDPLAALPRREEHDQQQDQPNRSHADCERIAAVDRFHAGKDQKRDAEQIRFVSKQAFQFMLHGSASRLFGIILYYIRTFRIMLHKFARFPGFLYFYGNCSSLPLRRAARPLAAVPPGGRQRGGLGSGRPTAWAELLHFSIPRRADAPTRTGPPRAGRRSHPPW